MKTNKASVNSKSSFDLSSTLKKFKKYELNSHVDIILLGSRFQSLHIQEIENNLEQMTQLSSINNGMTTYIKEKMIFHVSLAKHLEQSLTNVDQCDTFLTLLQQYHTKSASNTILYVLAFDNDLFINSCSETFISKEGFAYLNLNTIEKKQLVGSTSLGIHQFPSKMFWKDGTDVKVETTYLSMLIYRSIEQLIPTVQPNLNQDSQDNQENNSIHQHIQAHIFQLCGYPLGKCNPAENSQVLLTNSFDVIANHLKNVDELSINYSSSVLRVTDSLSITNAIFASMTKYSSLLNSMTSQQKRQILLFSSSELIAELHKTQEVQSILESNTQTRSNSNNQNQNKNNKIEETVTLSIFSLSLSDEFDGLFLPLLNNFNNQNQQQQTQQRNQQVEWYQTPLLVSEITPSQYSLGILRPSKSIPSTRGVLDSSLDYGTELRRRVDLNESISRDSEFEKREIFDKILELIWKISPPTSHYSSSFSSTSSSTSSPSQQQQMIKDYLWFDAFKRSTETFRDARVIPRQVIIQKTENLLRRFSTGLIYTNLNLYKNEFPNNQNAFPNELKNLFQLFDEISSSYSHLEYNSALQSISTIEKTLLQLETNYLNHNPMILSNQNNYQSQQSQQRFYLSCQMTEAVSSEPNPYSHLEVYVKFSALTFGLIFGFVLVLGYFRIFTVDSKRSTMRRVTR